MEPTADQVKRDIPKTAFHVPSCGDDLPTFRTNRKSALRSWLPLLFLTSPKDHHFTGCDEFPAPIFLLDEFKSPSFYRGQLLSSGVPSFRDSPRAVHRCEFLF